VSGKSPEAFEEIIWKHFWPERYESDRIQPWHSDDQNEEFNSFFRMHMRKIIAVRRRETDEVETSNQLRYLSKNNLNIARLSAPPEPLRTGTFLVPYRDPVQQAASMKRQHERFLQIHKEDEFVRECMEAIGHYEFGKNLQPVDFGGWVDEAPDPERLTFWAQYWIAAYRFIVEHAVDSIKLISYAKLTEQPEATLGQLADLLGIDLGELVEQAEHVRPPRTHSVEKKSLPDSVRQEADEIYDQLNQLAVL
jgi:hypothetical protein